MRTPMTWDQFVTLLRERLLARKGDWPLLCKGAPFTYRWLLAFARGRYRRVRVDLALDLARRLGLQVRVDVQDAPGLTAPASVRMIRGVGFGGPAKVAQQQ